MNRSTCRYRGRGVVDAETAEVVRLSQPCPYWGYRKIHALLDRGRHRVGRERVCLIRRREGLQVVKKRRWRKVLGQSTHWLYRAMHPDHVWSYDFVHDQTMDGRRLRCLTVVDEFTRKSLAIVIARSLTSHDVIQALETLIRQRGQPDCLRSDQGPEFITRAVKEWLEERSIGTHYIDPGSPWQNAYGESFNSIFRTTCLNRWAFESVREARADIESWRREYNDIRPHGS